MHDALIGQPRKAQSACHLRMPLCCAVAQQQDRLGRFEECVSPFERGQSAYSVCKIDRGSTRRGLRGSPPPPSAPSGRKLCTPSPRELLEVTSCHVLQDLPPPTRRPARRSLSPPQATSLSGALGPLALLPMPALPAAAAAAAAGRSPPMSSEEEGVATHAAAPPPPRRAAWQRAAPHGCPRPPAPPAVPATRATR